MPSTPHPQTDTNETIRVSDILVGYIRRNENSKAESAQVKCIRDIARHILLLNRDVLDIKVRKDQEPEITKDLIEFFGNGFGEMLTAAEVEAKEEGRELSQADIIRLVPDEKVIELAHIFRQNVVKAVRQNANSTTDSI